MKRQAGQTAPNMPGAAAPGMRPSQSEYFMLDTS